MLKWISKSGTLIQFTIYTALAAWLWVPAFQSPAEVVMTADDGPLYVFLANMLKQMPVFSAGIALFLVVLQSLFLFYTYQANGFFGRSNFIPAIIVLLAFSWNERYQTMHALLPACLFIVIAVGSILRMYGEQAPYRNVFSAAFALSVASLFYLPLVYMLLFLWLSLISYRISSWREYVISLIGFILPWVYYISLLFWNEQVVTGLEKIAGLLFNLVMPEELSLMNILWLSLSVAVLLLTMIAVLNSVSDKLINIRRRAWVLFGYCIASMVVVLLSGWPVFSANYLFVIPLSFFITGSISMIKRPFFFELLALAYFLMFVGMRYHIFM